jgi:hypothetical protein
MKKSKLFMATGAFILAATAIFATKANRRFTPGFTTGYANILGGVSVIAPSAIFTTRGGASLNRVFITISTINGTNLQGLKPLTKASGSTHQMLVTDVSNL